MNAEARQRKILGQLEDKLTFDPDGCWSWTAAKRFGGYGVISIDGRTTVAHRAVYELLVGPIPEGLTLDHLCRVRGCVNPSHLEPVTNRENILRGDTIPARHAAKTHCPKGHPYDEENTYVDKKGRRQCRQCPKDRRARGH